MTQSAPILTIGIPTYNRAELLREQLMTILPQAAKLGSAVEIIVSDNAGKDHTPEVVRELQKSFTFTYRRNETNIGVNGNIQKMTEAARGQFFWMQGDDDLLRDGAIEHILGILKREPDIDCIFMNNIYFRGPDREMYGADAAKYPTEGEMQCPVVEDRKLDRWEDIAVLTNAPSIFTFIGSHVVRLSKWKTTEHSLQSSDGYPNVEATFGHSCRVARMMAGKPAYYVGFPYIILFVGAQDWFQSWWPFLQTVQLTDLSDILEKAGASTKAVDHYRNTVFRTGSENFWVLCADKQMNGADRFSPWRMALKYGRYSEFWKMIFRNPQFKHYAITLPLWRIRAAVGEKVKQPLAKLVKRLFAAH